MADGSSRVARWIIAGLALLVVFLFARPRVSAWMRRRGDASQVEAIAAWARANPPVSQPTRGSSAWPRYRGPQTRGEAPTPVPLLARWPEEGPPELFRRPIGAGHAGVVVADGRIVTLEQRGPDEVVAAYDLGTGADLWSHAYPVRFTEDLGGDGPRATPTLHEGSVYAMGATGQLHALDAATGAVRWRHDVLEELETPNLPWGIAGSPLVADGLVIATGSGIDGPGFIAYDAETGAERWVSEWIRMGYASPVVATLAGRRQLLHLAGVKVVGLDLATGDLLWQIPWKTSGAISAAQPLVLPEDRVFVSTGYGTGAGVFALSATGGGWRHDAVWTSVELQNQFSSSVVRDGTLYGLDEDTLTALDAETGRTLWRGAAYGHGQLLLAGEHLLVQCEDGRIAWVEARPDRFVEVSVHEALPGRTWNVPTLVDGILLVRNDRELVAFDLRAGG